MNCCDCGSKQTKEEATKGVGEFETKWGRRYLCESCWAKHNGTQHTVILCPNAPEGHN